MYGMYFHVITKMGGAESMIEGCIFYINGLIMSRKKYGSNYILVIIPDSKNHGANMGPTWALSAPDGPHVGPMNLAIRDSTRYFITPEKNTKRKLL